MAVRRDKPYIYVTWISSLLYGSKSCKWAAWHRTHYRFKKTSEFNPVEHNLKHTALREQLLKDLRGKGCTIYLEKEVLMDRPRAIIAGRVDAIAVKGDRGMVFEIKSGKERDSDRIQLMIYMWLLPRVIKRFQNVLFEGMVVYKDKRIKVSSAELNEDFSKIFTDFIVDLIEVEPEQKHPNVWECKFCNILECDERISKDEEVEEVSDYLPAFLQ